MGLLDRPGGTTRQHRGLRSYVWSSGQTLVLVVLFVICWFLLAVSYEGIQRLWHSVLAWAWPHLGLGPASAVAMEQLSFLGLAWQVVGVQMQAAAPTKGQAWLWSFVLAILFVVSLVMPRRHLPWVYLLRAFVFLCAMSALAFFLVPVLFNVQVAGYFNDLLKIGSITLWLVPVLHAALLYVFPLSVIEKLVATALAVLFVIVSVPLQVGSLAWIVSQTNTLAMLPVYMLGTFLPPVFGQLGIYSYFVSGAKVSERRGGARPRLVPS